jgi:methionyl aminopeptidase
MSKDIKESFENTRAAGIIAANALDEVAKLVKPGVTTNEIDALCYEFINDNHAYSAPLFYRGFPKSCCTSTNHVICHGIPQNKILKDGDIINVDVTAFKNGWHGDTSRMFHAGELSVKAKKLINVTYDSMMRAIDILSTKVTLGDIGYTI